MAQGDASGNGRRPMHPATRWVLVALWALPGVWNIWWCLYSLVTQTPLKYSAGDGSTEGMLASVPWADTKTSDDPGGAVWWMALVMGQLWIALPAVYLLAAREMPRMRARLAAQREAAPQPPPDVEEARKRAFAADLKRAKTVAFALFCLGVVLSLGGIVVFLSSDGQAGWLLGAGMVALATLGVAALVVSLALPSCPACGGSVGQMWGEPRCPHCAATLR